MNSMNSILEHMMKEAIEELASGEHGTWREIPTNTLFLACVGMVMNHLTHKITRPLWFFAGSVFCGMVGWLISIVLGG
ncbi:unnamed protein product [marine sediment metagenome]|uniref:Uncharacterized protein n=1 Tax=marine sediment metagenome TaxID=412755 RepID=X1NSK3_9ZZZZ